MSAAKHTPGPWEMRPVPGLGCICIAQAGRMHGHAHVTEPAGEPNRLGPEEYANASLIVAAPSLLEALVDAVRYAQGGDIMHPNALDRARSAIAKAEGRQS